MDKLQRHLKESWLAISEAGRKKKKNKPKKLPASAAELKMPPPTHAEIEAEKEAEREVQMTKHREEVQNVYDENLRSFEEFFLSADVDTIRDLLLFPYEEMLEGLLPTEVSPTVQTRNDVLAAVQIFDKIAQKNGEKPIAQFFAQEMMMNQMGTDMYDFSDDESHAAYTSAKEMQQSQKIDPTLYLKPDWFEHMRSKLASMNENISFGLG
jgi:hypothetical protein